MANLTSYIQTLKTKLNFFQQNLYGYILIFDSKPISFVESEALKNIIY